MGKVIVYKGHPTRGKEVIRALEKLGGTNINSHTGDCFCKYYFIDRCGHINSINYPKMVLLDYCEVRELEPKLPKTLLEIHKINNPNTTFNENSIKTISWIDKLILLKNARDIYNDGWQPDWSDSCEKHVIIFNSTRLTKSLYWHSNKIFAFKDSDIADLFIIYFREELTEVLTELYK